MARQSPRDRAVKVNKNMVNSHVIWVSGNTVHVSDSSKYYVKAKVNPVSGVNASHTNVKVVAGSDADVMPLLSSKVSHSNVNPTC